MSGTVREIRIYVEGGGDSHDSLRRLREGIQALLQELCNCARRKKIRWSIIACGGRNRAFDSFQRALITHPDAFNVLLVDAEESVQDAPWTHLHRRDNWQQPSGTSDEHCQLMIQAMEAWLIADPDTLAAFYGQGFNRSALPKNTRLENINKVQLSQSLLHATRQTQKGPYHKINHGTELLKRISPAAVQRRAPSCRRLFSTLSDKMGGC